MLFVFNDFWKTLLFLSLTWLSYGLFGFEITIVSLLVFLLVKK